MIWGYVSRPQAARMKGKEVLSRVPQSSEMTDKGKLFENLSKYCDKKSVRIISYSSPSIFCPSLSTSIEKDQLTSSENQSKNSSSSLSTSRKIQPSIILGL